MSAPTCVQMHAWSSTTGDRCECAQDCVTSDGSALPHGKACGLATGNQTATCNFGVCDGPPTTACGTRGGDTDGDGVCDDGDGDSFEHSGDICGRPGSPPPPDCDDNCWGPTLGGFNPSQTNTDQDNFGDLCDRCEGIQDTLETPDHYQRDSDIDSRPDECDTCPAIPDSSNSDRDGDTWGDACDNCRAVPNGPAEGNVPGVGNQADEDEDTLGDPCDSTSGLPGETDGDGDGMSFGLEQLAGTSDGDPDSDDDAILDWIEWTVYGTDPTDQDTDNDGIHDNIEIAQGSDPLDPTSFFGLCSDVNLDIAVNVVDLAMMRRQLAASSLPAAFTPNRCNNFSAGTCTAADVSELRAHFANPTGSLLADVCPSVPHDVITTLFTMDGQESLWDPATATSIANDSTVFIQGTGSLVAQADGFVDASIEAPLVPTPQNWTGDRLRFAMLVPNTSQIAAADGVRVTLSSSTFSSGSSNRVWFLGTSDIPQGIWKEYEIDPSTGWDQSSGTFNIGQVRWIRVQWNLDEAGPTGRLLGEFLYLDDLKRVLPASP